MFFYRVNGIANIERSIPEVKRMAQLLKDGKISVAKRELDKIITPKLLDEARDLQKQMTKVSPSEMMRQFTM